MTTASKGRYFAITLLLFLAVMVVNCGETPKKENPHLVEMDARTKTRFRQYMIMGKRLYLRECANCHGEQGQGLADLIPPLAGADYLMNGIERAVCQVRNGITGEIQVNGKNYNQEMPANPGLKALEIAEILTYVTNSWGNEYGLLSTKNAQNWLDNCP